MKTTDQAFDLVDEDEAARLLDVSPRTLQKHRFESRGAPYLRIGRLIRYRVDDLKDYLETRRCIPDRQGRANRRNL